MFDVLKALGNPMELMRKAKEVQDRMKAIQDELAGKQVTADAGGGMVTATVNGKLELVKLRIDRSKLQVNPADAGSVELFEDLVVAAVAAAQSKAADLGRQEMQKMAAEAGLPPGMLPS